MAVKLIYKHQQKTYDLMKDALEKKGRAAYVFPTGCGKSFPALKYIEENLDKKVTIFAPNLGIKNQYIKYIETYVENGKERLKNGNIEIKTYQKIYSAKKEKKERAKRAREKKSLIPTRKNIKAFSLKKFFDVDSDIVIFDEIHRMGAKKWEDVVDNIMQGNPNRKVIGMSATPERTDGRNMAYEKFGDDVVYEMSLTEALSGEKEGEVVLKTPKYIRVLSQLKPLIDEQKEQIKSIEDEEERNKLLKKYEKIDSIVNNSPSLSDVMLEGMKKKNGKYIVFCKDRKDMLEKMQQAGEIFGKVNTKINTNYVISKNGKKDEIGKTDAQNRKTLEEFENKSEGDELNLLFCVDMLNEGVHIPKVDGEVLFDLTNSAILYKQRIGRVLSADKEAGETVIIDAANNWLNHIDTYKEIENAIKIGGQKDRNGNKNQDYNLLKLFPEEVDLLQVMKEVGESLRYDKNKIYKKIIEWLETHDRNLPRLKTEEEITSNMSKERKDEINLRERWRKCEIKKILDGYAGQPIEEVPEEYRDKISKLRSLGQLGELSLEEKENVLFNRIIQWLKTHSNNLPRLKGKKEIASNMSRERKDEINLRERWRKCETKKILDKYVGQPLENVPEEYRDKIKILRDLGQLGEKIKERKEKTTFEELVEWLDSNDGQLPNGSAKNDKFQINLYSRWNTSKERKILESYIERPIEEVPEEYRKKIAKLRSYGLGVSTYEKMIDWLEKNNGNLPRGTISKNGKNMTFDKLSEEERKELRLYHLWGKSDEKKVLNEYAGRPIEEVPEEYRDKIKTLRSLIFKEKTTYEQIVEWLETHDGKMPRTAIIRDGKRYSAAEMSQDEKYEKNLYLRWDSTNEKKVLNEYAERPIEEVPEEYREKITKLRSLGQLGEKKDKKITARARACVSKNIKENDETRKELETIKQKENEDVK